MGKYWDARRRGHVFYGETVVPQRYIPAVCWGIGLSDVQSLTVQRHLGPEHELRVWPCESMPGVRDMEDADPCLLWVTPESSRRICMSAQEPAHHLELLPKALLLDDDYSLEDFEDACDTGVTEILRPPLTQKRVREVVRRALETRNAHLGMLCMTREILLERELLERKNETLSFLVNFLASTSQDLDLEAILGNAFKGLGMLFPARAMHVVLWNTDRDSGSRSVSLHIGAQDDLSPSHAAWRSLLLEHARQALGEGFTVAQTPPLPLPARGQGWENAAPDRGCVVALPVSTPSESVGMLLLQTEAARNLGRDQAFALDSAMNHLALNIKNSRKLYTLRQYADYDALTRVHSRRHFEERLEEELLRFERYGQLFSLLLLDIDYFKQVNDTWGHQAGDAVLRDMASLVSSVIRGSDYCARYGGEEFVILLTHTGEEKGLQFAERLRKRIASHTFVVEGSPLKLTASLGLSWTAPGVPTGRDDLLRRADAALYAAKAEGRNRAKAAEFPVDELLAANT